MDVLRDASWMRELYLSAPTERFRRGRFLVTAVSSRPTPSHHLERYRYRLLFVEAGQTHPALSINLESDLLGTWRLTVTKASGTRIAMAFDEPPGYEAFKAAALGLADEELSVSEPGAVSAGRRRRGAPRVPKGRG